ncbi:CrcB family protein [Jeotgalibacillus sp. S-D1]|uniref:fluoride efflux transporter FluC n=1 Tax=Jeotgalibacillus sp. S-D1 TaxID=2552189 RepID=UPI00105A5F00|nr:CrcB family protein [Jeotgalibacillus sp. S-D1]TDL34872.1 CrcB family protein [Jeotgalibacillus sp. S-D1]
MLFIAAGGALGAIARWGISCWLNSIRGTIAVNLAGSLIGGYLLYLSMTESFQMFFITGFLGSFTTFSTLQTEGMKMITGGKLLKGISYSAAVLLGSLAAAVAGYLLAAI